MSDTRVCAWCGKTFERGPRFSNATWAKTRCCSRSCGAYLRSQSPEYLAKLGAARRAWNEAHPEANVERLRKGAASKGGQYPSPDPKARGRTIARQRVAYRPCDDCGEWKRGYRDMHIHHIDLDQTHNDPANLAVLCSTCHGKRHRGDRTRRNQFGPSRALR